MKSQEMVISTIKKVYAIREAVERRSTEERGLKAAPLIGPVAVRLSSIALTKDQFKDVSAFVTASCPDPASIKAMEVISSFKSRKAPRKPLRVWLSYLALLLPILLVILAEAYLYYRGMITRTPYYIATFAVLVVAVVLSVVIFAMLGYDRNYRRECIELSIWKAIHDECTKKGASHKKIPQLTSGGKKL
jgi:hypothetical protein